MPYCRLEIQDAKKIKVEDDNDDDPNNHNNHEPAVVCHNFWHEAPEDLLMEIFIRHPDCRSAVRTSTVCRQWHSLILRNPLFIQRFKSRHQHKIFPWTIMFRSTNYYKQFQILCQLYSDEWMFLHGKTLPANCLDFFLPSYTLIKAWYNDLLLVSPCGTDDLYICNPVTKQFVQLPAIPRLEDPVFYHHGRIGYALVAMPTSGANTNTNTQFKVVVIFPLDDHWNFLSLQVSVFCSESKEWERREYPVPLPTTWWSYGYFSNIIRCNEILFWVGTSLGSERILYLDLSKEKYGIINMPSGVRLIGYRFGILHVSGGLDELRLIQALSMDTAETVRLRVWRLNNNNDHEDDDSNWILVHDKKLKRPKNLSEEQPFAGPFVHPTNGDLVFVVWDKTVIEYNLIDETYKKIAELLETAYWYNLTAFSLDLSSGYSNLANTYF